MSITKLHELTWLFSCAMKSRIWLSDRKKKGMSKSVNCSGKAQGVPEVVQDVGTMDRSREEKGGVRFRQEKVGGKGVPRGASNMYEAPETG